MALIELGLNRISVEQRSVWDGHLTTTQQALLTGSIPGAWEPAVLGACIERLSGVLAAADVDALVRPHLPWIARQMVTKGEVVLLLDDRLRLVPVEEFELAGSAASRRYRSLTTQGTSRSETYRTVSPEQVVHAVIRPEPNQPWRGRHWWNAGFAVRQLVYVDEAIRQAGAEPRGTLLPTVAAESEKRLRKLLAGLMSLRGGLSSHPLLGRQGEQNGPSPAPVRLQTNSLPELVKAHESLRSDLAESLGVPGALLGYGLTTQTSRPDALRAWIASTAGGTGARPGAAGAIGYRTLFGASGSIESTPRNGCPAGIAGLVQRGCATTRGGDMTGVLGRITRAGNYDSLVSVADVRTALNLQSDAPTDMRLAMHVGEAAMRVEGLTRVVLPTQTWQYTIRREYFLEHDSHPDAIFLPGLFALGTTTPTVSVADADGAAIPVTAEVQGHGEEIWIQGEDWFVHHPLPITGSISRGVAPSKLPADLRSAIITQVEMLVDGFTPLGEASIVRTVSRWR